MNSRSLHALLFGLLVCAGSTADSASAYCRMTTEGGAQQGDAPCIEKGQPLVWDNPCLTYAIDQRGSRWFKNPDGTPDLAELTALVDESFFTWRNADCGGAPPNLIFQPLASPSTCQRAEFNTVGNVNTIAFLDPWKDPCAETDDLPYPPLAFAVTVVWHNTDTGQILDADLMVNDQLATRFNAGGPYGDCPDTGCPAGSVAVPGDADLRSILTHEIGHFVGIGHSDVAGSTMFASAERTSVEKRTLAQDDIDAVCAVYPPGNLDASCDATPIGGLLLNCETTPDGDPIACDSPAAASNGGGCSAYTTMRSPGDTWVTLLLALFGLTVVRRRSTRRGAQS